MRAAIKEQQILPSVGSFVRYLGGFEHLHWLFSQSGPRAFAHAMEVTGTMTVKQWRAALDALQLSQPFFSVLINDCLHLLHTAYSPLPHLLKGVRATLIAMYPGVNR
jgi:hypothetical protein